MADLVDAVNENLCVMVILREVCCTNLLSFLLCSFRAGLAAEQSRSKLLLGLQELLRCLTSTQRSPGPQNLELGILLHDHGVDFGRQEDQVAR